MNVNLLYPAIKTNKILVKIFTSINDFYENLFKNPSLNPNLYFKASFTGAHILLLSYLIIDYK